MIDGLQCKNNSFHCCVYTVVGLVACSPAQAAAAPAVMPEQSAVLAAQYGRYTGQNAVHEQQVLSQLSQSPRVVCEPFRSSVQVKIFLVLLGEV